MSEICSTASLMADNLGRGIGVVVSMVNCVWISVLCFLGLSKTSVIGVQLRVLADQRCGFSSLAFSSRPTAWLVSLGLFPGVESWG